MDQPLELFPPAFLVDLVNANLPHMSSVEHGSVVTGLCGRQMDVAECDNCTIVPLSSLSRGECARLVAFRREQDMTICRRLFDLGFHVGTQIEMVRRAPIGGPIVFRVAGAELLLRRSEAERILVSAA